MDRTANAESGLKPKKKGIIIGIVALALIALIVILIIPTGYMRVGILEIFGEVTYDRGSDKNIPVYDNMNLSSGDTMHTGGDDSFARMSLDDDKVVFLEQNSELNFDLAKSFGSKRIKLNLAKGSIVNEIEKPLRTKDSYEVRTPNATMAVRGTRFRVSTYYDKNGILYTRISGLEGKVECKKVLPDGTIDESSTVVATTGNEAIIFYDKANDETDFVTFDKEGTPLPPKSKGKNTRPLKLSDMPIQVLNYISQRMREGVVFDGFTADELEEAIEYSRDNFETEPIMINLSVGIESGFNSSDLDTNEETLGDNNTDITNEDNNSFVRGNNTVASRSTSGNTPSVNRNQNPAENHNENPGFTTPVNPTIPNTPVVDGKPDSPSNDSELNNEEENNNPEDTKEDNMEPEEKPPVTNPSGGISGGGGGSGSSSTPQTSETITADPNNIIKQLNDAFTRSDNVTLNPFTAPDGSQTVNLEGSTIPEGKTLTIAGNNTTTTSDNPTVNGTLVAPNGIQSNGNINVGRTGTIQGDISGNTGNNSITSSGNIDGNISDMDSVILNSGTVTGNISSTNNVNVGAGATVEGNIELGGSSTTISGSVNGTISPFDGSSVNMTINDGAYIEELNVVNESNTITITNSTSNNTTIETLNVASDSVITLDGSDDDIRINQIIYDGNELDSIDDVKNLFAVQAGTTSSQINITEDNGSFIVSLGPS